MSGIERCVVLAGGTGGAKLAAGMQDLLGTGLSVIANTADDIEIVGVDVSPDPDLITYWLSGEIDEQRGWGIKGDSFTAFDRLARLGAPDWFRLSDRDLATCLYRRVFVADGGRRTDAQAQIGRALGVRAAVLPMCEERVRTRVQTAQGWRDLQRYLVAEHAEAPVEGIEVDGIADAVPTPEVLSSIAEAEAIVIGPSNPVISIGPILADPGAPGGDRRRGGARGGGQPLRRRAGGEGTDRSLHAGGRAAIHRRGGRLAVRGPDRRHGLRRRGPRSTAPEPAGARLPDPDGGA